MRKISQNLNSVQLKRFGQSDSIMLGLNNIKWKYSLMRKKQMRKSRWILQKLKRRLSIKMKIKRINIRWLKNINQRAKVFSKLSKRSLQIHKIFLLSVNCLTRIWTIRIFSQDVQSLQILFKKNLFKMILLIYLIIKMIQKVKIFLPQWLKIFC